MWQKWQNVAKCGKMRQNVAKCGKKRKNVIKMLIYFYLPDKKLINYK